MHFEVFTYGDQLSWIILLAVALLDHLLRCYRVAVVYLSLQMLDRSLSCFANYRNFTSAD